MIEADAGRRRIVVEGMAANINKAFAITLKRYRAPQRHLPRPTPKLNEPDAARVTTASTNIVAMTARSICPPTSSA